MKAINVINQNEKYEDSQRNVYHIKKVKDGIVTYTINKLKIEHTVSETTLINALDGKTHFSLRRIN